jgi:hypothetical protein
MESVVNYDNAFAAFQAAATAMAGDSKPLLKFQKGDWYVGQDNEEIPLGAAVAVDMFHAEWGWIRWSNNKPAERRMVLIASGQPIVPRDTLGYNDEGMWDRDDEGKPRDPWRKTVEIPTREVNGAKREFLMAGSGVGFEGGMKALLKAFGEQMRTNAGKIAIIELRADKYTHPKYGIVKVPSMPLVGWKTAAELEGTTNGNGKPKAATKF